MSLPIALHGAAQAEFIEAAAWYDSKRSGLGMEFIAEIDRCVALASTQPRKYALVRADIRRVVVNRFPYSVYFRAEQNRVVVLAVFHSSRDPAIWLGRA
jgi:toxin ParE1/3/4